MALVVVTVSLQAQTPTPPRILSLNRQGEGLGIEWTSAGTGFAYTLQSRPSLDSGIWLSLSGARPWPITGTSWSGSPGAAAGSNSGFFRVIAVPAAERGRILSVTKVQSMPQASVGFALSLSGVALNAQYGVDVYKVVYETLDPFGGRTQASGSWLIPQGVTKAMPMATYQHGTVAQAADAPSAGLGAELLVGVAFATSGYAALVPDYLGLGDSKGVQPYLHARSESTACVDLLRAARTWCATNKVTLNGQLFLLGYSQGGHVTMALHRELEAFHPDEFSVTASAPMAGPYDLSGTTLADFLSGRSMGNPYYFALLLASYQSVYGLTASISDWLAAPYDKTLPPLLGGSGSSSALNAALPKDLTKVLKPEVLQAIRSNPNHPLRIALADNDLLAWTPKAPIRLYHCSGDLDVAPANSRVALDQLRAHGAGQIALFDPVPGADHGSCAIPSLLAAKTWFDSLKKN